MEKNPVYILHGDARLLIEEALAKLIEKHMPTSNVEFNYDVFDAETTDMTHVIAAANTLPVFADHRLVVVRRVERHLENKKSDTSSDAEFEDEDVGEDSAQGKTEEKDDALGILFKYLENPNPHATLIMVAARKLDSRKKTYKELNKLAKFEVFNEPQYRDTTTWLIERAKETYNKRLSFDAAQFLIAAVGRTSGVLASELEKLALFNVDKKEISIDAVKLLTAENSNIVIFDFIDALVEKKPQLAVDILEELIKRGEYPAKIIVILAGQVRSLISAKALRERGLNKTEMAKQMGVKSDFVIQKYLRHEKYFTMDGLIKTMNFLSEADYKTKMGLGDAHNLLLNAVVRIAGLIK